MRVAPCRENHLIGLDVGATKIAAGIGTTSGKILHRLTLPTIRKNPQHLMEQITTVIQELKDFGMRGEHWKPKVGIGICGGVQFPSGVVSSPIALGWGQPVPLQETLSARSGLAVWVDNDVNAGAVGEMLWGGARGLKHFIYISVGTGVGGGIVINGEIYRGAHQAAGEIGHVTVDVHGRQCACGNWGCLEALAGGKSLAEAVSEEIKISRLGTSPLLEAILHSGQEITTKDIFKGGEEGDSYCQEVIAALGEYLAAAVASLTNLLDPEKIIIGGGLTQTGDLLFSAVRASLKKWRACLVDSSEIFSPAMLGADTGIAGAMGIALLRSGDEKITNPHES